MQPVLDFLKKNEQWFVQELCDYVRFPSVSAQPKHKADLTACAHWIAKHCSGIGLLLLGLAHGGHIVWQLARHKM